MNPIRLSETSHHSTLSISGARKDIGDSAIIFTHSASGRVPIKSWKTSCDEGVIKQNLDFSCGAASLATLLGGYYGQHVTEQALLIAMDKGTGRASFDDMARGLSQFGFRAQGFAASWEQLVRLKMPVVVYVKHDRGDHFTVLRGINSETVWLADSSAGNRTYSREQFLAMWQTRINADGLSGKFLAILPANPSITSSNAFFTKTPRRQSANAKINLAFRVQP
ncbi:peptidase C39 [Pseudoduganella umbonata]|uniref:Peptidase C39 n=1 Tax=Pseudoduganella umbonata TaxID=864828 RepID=A0ABX5USL6_9BURK|nr:peptidase C39 [Pseudoduganella umbonata]